MFKIVSEHSSNINNEIGNIIQTLVIIYCISFVTFCIHLKIVEGRLRRGRAGVGAGQIGPRLWEIADPQFRESGP